MHGIKSDHDLILVSTTYNGCNRFHFGSHDTSYLFVLLFLFNFFLPQEWAVSVKDICNYAIDPRSAPGADRVDESRYTLEPVDSRWQGFCQSILSKVDEDAQAKAAEYIMSIDTGDLEPGTGLASTLLFIWESS